MKATRLKLGISLVAALAMAFLPSLMTSPVTAATEAAKGPIRIGVVLPLSSQSGASGKNILKGMNLYFDKIKNTIAGRPIELIVENSESSPATGAAKFHKLIDQDHVPLIAGCYLSSELYACAPIADAGKTPFVVVSAGADNITQRQRSHWIVRTCYTGSMMSHPLGDYAAKKLGHKKVVCIANDYAYGYEVVGGFQKTFEAAGGKVIQKIWIPLGFTDFSESIKSIRKDADAIFVANVGQSAELFPKQYFDIGPKLPLLGNHTVFDESILQKIGDYVNGSLSVSTYATLYDSPGNVYFVKDFYNKYGADSSIYSANGYLTAMWIHKAIDSIKGDVENKEKLMSALRSIEIKDAPQGPIKLDSYGQAICNVYLRKVTKRGEKYENKIISTFPAVSQFWKFNPEEYMKAPSYAKDYPPCTFCQK